MPLNGSNSWWLQVAVLPHNSGYTFYASIERFVNENGTLLQCQNYGLYSQLAEAQRGLGVVRFHVLQDVPLVDAQLAGRDAAAAVEVDPSEGGATGVVVVTASDLAGLVERLDGRPDAAHSRSEEERERRTADQSSLTTF